MITPATIDRLYALRKESCRCGTIMNMPDFHDDDCPYKPLGKALLLAEEAKPAEDRHVDA